MKTFYIGKEIQNNNKLYEGGVTMKTLTKMFLLACWSLCFVTMSFAASTEQKLADEAERLELQQVQQIDKEAQFAEKEALRLEERERRAYLNKKTNSCRCYGERAYSKAHEEGESRYCCSL